MGGRVRAVLGVGATLLVAVVFLAPLVLVVLGSLRPVGLPPPRFGELLSGPFTVEAYRRLSEVLPLGTPLANSVVVAAITVPVGVLVAAWAGFAIARLPRRHATFLVTCAVLVLLVPVTSLFVGRLMLFEALGLTDTLVPLIAASLLGVSPLFVLLFAWSYRRIPPELLEAATELSPTPISAWWRVAVPLTRGPTAAAAALAFLLTWNDYLGPLIYLTDQRRATLPLAVGTLAGLDGPRQPIMLAGTVVALAPAVLVVAVLARRIVSGWKEHG